MSREAVNVDEVEELGLAGFPPLPAVRKAERDFWDGIELISSGAAIMRDWEWALGGKVGFVRPFLRPTGRRVSEMACPVDPPCGCQHAVRGSEMYGLVAACCCESGWCETFRIGLEDVLVHGLDRDGFGGAIARALGLARCEGAVHQGDRLFEIGRCVAVASPVYFGMGDEETLLREIRKLSLVREGPFLLLTPTGKACGAQLEQELRQHCAGHISMSAVLEVGNHERLGNHEIHETHENPETTEANEGNKERGPGAGRVFRAKEAAGPMLAEFVDRVAKARRSGSVLSSIHREIAAVRSEFVELRSAKQRLEKMLADGFFAFMRKVDATSFKVLCTVLAEGDVAKASRTLGMADGSVRTLMRRWRGMGKEYRAMLDLVRWRKAVGRKETVMLNDQVLLGKTESANYPEVIADVLEKVTEMTGENWQEKAEELEEMLSEMKV